ncbi:MAG: hypothetical protein CMJ18_13810 [Phycisphaeraceae bacterium]|nr:hypothetical protein [Phycisphaeraceae bacterium]
MRRIHHGTWLSLLAVSLVLSLLLLARLNRFMPVQRAMPVGQLAGSIDFNDVYGSITEDSVGAAHRRIVAAPTRLSGSPGEAEVSRWIERQFAKLELDILIQEFPVTVPVTKWCALLDADGAPVAGITIEPAWPNLVRTCTTPPEGLTAEVIDAGLGTLADLEGRDVEGKIALIRMGTRYEWLDAARLGAVAILFRRSNDPEAWNHKHLGFPADLPRFVVDGRVDDLAGRTVCLRARVDWTERTARNVLGVLEPDGVTDEALTLVAHTDSWSVTPARAPGYFEACGAATLVETARALHRQRAGLRRKIVFAALTGKYQAWEGVRRFLDSHGSRLRYLENRGLVRGRLESTGRRAGDFEGLVNALAGLDYWSLGAAEETRFWADRGRRQERLFTDVLRDLLDRHVADLKHEAEQARIAWVSAGRPPEGELLVRNLEVVQRLRQAMAAVTADPVDLKVHFGEVVSASSVRGELVDALEQARDRSLQEREYHRQTLALSDFYAPLKHSYFFLLTPSSIGGQLGFDGDVPICLGLESARDVVVRSWYDWKGNDVTTGLDAPIANGAKMRVDGLRARWQPGWVLPGRRLSGGHPRPNVLIGRAAHAVIDLATDRYPRAYQTPLDRSVDLAALRDQAQLIAGLTAQLGAGIDPMEVPGKAASGITSWYTDIGGKVVSGSGGQSLLPTRGAPDALVVLYHNHLGDYAAVQKTDRGRFRFPSANVNGEVLVDAYSLDPATGRLTGARDWGPDGQRYLIRMTHKGIHNVWRELETWITVLMARLAPTDIYQPLGPDGAPVVVDVVDAPLSVTPQQYSITQYADQGATVFVPPGDRFHAVLRYTEPGARVALGAARESMFVHSYLLGGNEQDGRAGFLAGKDRRIVFQERAIAAGMAEINRHRLEEQARNRVADAPTQAMGEQADRWLAKGIEAAAAHRHREAYRALTASWAISARIYPSIRLAVLNAVNGILLYMFLMIPFSFFAERLLFAFRDVRARLAGMFAVFLVVFTIIRWTHPAYRMVSSAMIILAGFVIFILCLLILGFLIGKFSERIRAIRQMTDQDVRATAADGAAPSAVDPVSSADVSRLSASAAAFSLGLSNMRKRWVRTTMTVVTLTLITFCLVCFTAPRAQRLDRSMPIGPADHEGVLVRRGLSLSAVENQFDSEVQVIPRRAFPMRRGMSYVPSEGRTRAADAEGVIYMGGRDARVCGADRTLLPGGRWFDEDDPDQCILGDRLAGELGIDTTLVGQGGVRISFLGRMLVVRGIFDSRALERLRDFDGESILPMRGGADAHIRELEEQGQRMLEAAGPARRDTISRVPAERVVLLPFRAEAHSGQAATQAQFTSVILLFDGLPHGRTREIIGEMLDRSTSFVRYAVDGVAYFGARLRAVSVEQYVDVVVPLAIAALIVLSTMLGSVYERQREISVYSAVGLAPHHVFFVFLAESLVYAVVGIVGGYILALVLQWISHLGDGALGLTMNFSSRSAIYVAVTLMAAVIASSFIPARRAARIASPSERSGWSAPAAAEAGRLRFELPFTFLGLDSVAVIAYLTEWFDVHGQDASGPFAATHTQAEVSWGGDDPSFTLAATIWLRPYDLGVSQRLRIRIRPVEQDGMYGVFVEIDQLSGGEPSWRRTNERFVRLLRRHLLRWRSVSPMNRGRLVSLATEMLGGTSAASI